MPKNIVVCLDGTWNNSANVTTGFTNPSVIHQSASPLNQIKFYRHGVGENAGWIAKRLYGIIGKGVFQQARLAWTDVAANYIPGDRIFIFGFSRGAFAARHLAGMIVRFGLKGYPPGQFEHPFREWLKAVTEPCVTVQQKVHFLGLFDCVPGNRFYAWRDRNPGLNTKTLEPGIIHFRHAVSRDERRWSFRPLLFNCGKQASFAQHWFPGYHSDVGGGKGIADGLASFSLWWMIREAYAQGLAFTNIECSLHRAGHALGVIRNVDPDAAGVCSDYWSTRLGLVWNRSARETDPAPDPTPTFSDLASCPLCDKDMFDYFLTDHG